LPSWKINQFSLSPTIYRKICNKKAAKSSLKTGLCLELPPQGFISQWVMPENQIPAAQPEPDEFNFAKPAMENPRIRRRSLKAKPGGLLIPSGGTPSAAREVEREAPSLSAEQAAKPRPQETVEAAADLRATAEKNPRSEIAGHQPKPKQASENSTREVKTAPSVNAPEPASRTTPSPATTPSPSPASAGATSKTTATTASSPTTSPHGTRPATLYYSSHPRKAESPSPMKTIPTASPASSSSSSSTTLPSSAARPATSSPRPATAIDYRSNVERQSREQKSVGNILAYVVYGLIGFFVISAGLALYGADVIFKQIHDQSVTVSDLDQRYAAANKDLNAKLAATQDILIQAQAQIARQQSVIVNQQEELNRLIAATNDNLNAIKAEKQARAQETASLRAQVRDLGNRPNYTQKF
jgi:hypothetical protein